MREIKFRGKRVDSGEWVYGDFTRSEELSHITSFALNSFCKSAPFYVIERETLGQYTGLKDCNGVEIYEGDVLNRYTRRDRNNWAEKPSIINEENEVIVIFNNGAFVTDWAKINICELKEFFVVRSIHDNPELLESDK